MRSIVRCRSCLIQRVHKKESDEGWNNNFFRENDKVMLLKNLPDDDVYNGDIGTILEVDTKRNVISVDFTNNVVDFSTDFLYYLKACVVY